MSEDWAGVATAVTQRLRDLGWRQRQLAERSHVSQAIVREIQHHTVERRRSARTLAALSTALGWHPTHLDEVLHGRAGANNDQTAESTIISAQTGWSRLDDLDERVRGISSRLDELIIEVRTVLSHVPSNP